MPRAPSTIDNFRWTRRSFCQCLESVPNLKRWIRTPSALSAPGVRRRRARRLGIAQPLDFLRPCCIAISSCFAGGGALHRAFPRLWPAGFLYSAFDRLPGLLRHPPPISVSRIHPHFTAALDWSAWPLSSPFPRFAGSMARQKTLAESRADRTTREMAAIVEYSCDAIYSSDPTVTLSVGIAPPNNSMATPRRRPSACR